MFRVFLLQINLHPYQDRAFKSHKKIIVCAAGVQSGKTHVGPVWLAKHFFQHKDPSDTFIVCAPTYKLLAQASLPKFMSMYKHYGTFKSQAGEFHVHGGGVIYFRSLDNPESIEGISNCRAVWADEAAMLSRYAFENIRGRVSRLGGPILITSTPYALNWLYEMYQDWKKGLAPYCDFIVWKSVDSPYFPEEFYLAEQKRLSPERFKMKYMGEFGKMTGLVFEQVNVCEPFALPSGTKYYGGIDFGYTNPFALVIVGLTPEGKHYRVAEFYKAGLFMDQIVDICKQRKSIYDIEMFVCDPSDPRAIQSLNNAGIPAIAGKNDIRLGIDLMSELFRMQRYFIFNDNLKGLDEYSTYHYPEIKEEASYNQDVKEQLPVKANEHGIDASRYLAVYLENSKATHMMTPKVPGEEGEPLDRHERYKWLTGGGSSRYNN